MKLHKYGVSIVLQNTKTPIELYDLLKPNKFYSYNRYEIIYNDRVCAVFQVNNDPSTVVFVFIEGQRTDQSDFNKYWLPIVFGKITFKDVLDKYKQCANLMQVQLQKYIDDYTAKLDNLKQFRSYCELKGL